MHDLTEITKSLLYMFWGNLHISSYFSKRFFKGKQARSYLLYVGDCV